MDKYSELPYSALVIDDNTFNREVFRLALEASDYIVEEAQNGLEALTILAERTFDLAVIDLQMPFLNGGAVLNAIRLDSSHTRMKIIVATANPHMATQDVEMSSDYILYKPIDVHEFAILASRLKERRSTVPPLVP
jgi:CheY-like chemotaxis protein